MQQNVCTWRRALRRIRDRRDAGGHSSLAATRLRDNLPDEASFPASAGRLRRRQFACTGRGRDHGRQVQIAAAVAEIGVSALDHNRSGATRKGWAWVSPHTAPQAALQEVRGLGDWQVRPPVPMLTESGYAGSGANCASPLNSECRQRWALT